MERLLSFLQKNSRIILNFSIVFLCVVISLYLLMKKETAEVQESFVKQQVETTFNNIKTNLSGFVDRFIPISPSIRADNPADDEDLNILNKPNLEPTDSSAFKIMDFIKNPMIQDIFYKSILGVLVTYLFVTLIMRKR